MGFLIDYPNDYIYSENSHIYSLTKIILSGYVFHQIQMTIKHGTILLF